MTTIYVSDLSSCHRRTKADQEQPSSLKASPEQQSFDDSTVKQHTMPTLQPRPAMRYLTAALQGRPLVCKTNKRLLHTDRRLSTESEVKADGGMSASVTADTADSDTLDINGRMYNQAELARIVAKVAAASQNDNRRIGGRSRRKPSPAPSRASARAKDAGVDVTDLETQDLPKGLRSPERPGRPQTTFSSANSQSDRSGLRRPLRSASPRTPGRTARVQPTSSIKLENPPTIFSRVPGFPEPDSLYGNAGVLQRMTLRSPLSNVLPVSHAAPKADGKPSSIMATVGLLLEQNASLSDRKRQTVLQNIQELVK